MMTLLQRRRLGKSLLVFVILLFVGNCIRCDYQIRRHIASDEAYTFALLSDRRVQDELLAAGRSLTYAYSQKDDKRNEDIDIPAVIMQFRPRYVFIYKDQTHIVIESPGGRTTLICFDVDADEYGTRMVTQGLWYWNLNVDKDFPELQRLYDRVNKGEASTSIQMIVDATGQLVPQIFTR